MKKICIINKIEILSLTERYYKSKAPIIKIIYMFDYFDPNSSEKILTPILINSIKKTIKNNKQCIILNNRRGYASSVFSKEAKNPFISEYCKVPMTFHTSFLQLLCHYCNDFQHTL